MPILKLFRFAIFVFALMALAVTPVSFAQQAGSADKVHSEMLVSTQWLSAHLKDPKVVILHVADNMQDYKRGHIPGARFLDQNKFTETVGDLNTELPSPEKLQKLFSELGVGDSTRVVIYATNWMPNAARAYVTLDYVGHGDRAALLDGGIEQWLNEDRPVSGETPKYDPATFTVHVNEGVRALLDQVKGIVDAKSGDASIQIVDARPARRYSAGHLSGATNIYWQDTLVSEQSPVFQSPEKLRALYSARGIVPGKKIITYCEIGMQASHGYFL